MPQTRSTLASSSDRLSAPAVPVTVPEVQPTVHNNKEVLEYWNRANVESMYDKHLLKSEIDLIRRHIPDSAKVLDAGCGEGEGTCVYCQIPGATVQAVDFSGTRLAKAAERLGKRDNVTLKKVDFLGSYDLDRDYNAIVSQRFLINLVEWRLQQKVLSDLASRLAKGGKLILLEGSQQGVDELNHLRVLLGLEPVPVKWHNLFLNDQALVEHLTSQGLTLEAHDGLGAFFVLTRGIRPALDSNLNWDSPFNLKAANPELADLLGFGPRFSRLRLWVFRR
jgi:SAM-dependent methyltransferase